MTATKEWVDELQESLKPLRIIVLGESGCGKSMLVNNLLHAKVAKVGDTPSPETTKITRYTGQLEGKDIVVYDTPGLEDDGVVEKLREVIEYRHMVVVVCLKMTEKRTNRSLVQVLNKLDVNKTNTMIALTFADVIPGMSSSAAKGKDFTDKLISWRERLAKEFWNLDSNLIFPTTSDRSKHLPTGDPFSPLCSAILRTFSMRVVYSYPAVREDECRLSYGDCLSNIGWNKEGVWAYNTDMSADLSGLFHPMFVAPYDVKVERLKQKDRHPLDRPHPSSHEAVYDRKTLFFAEEPKDWYSCCICRSLAIQPAQTTCCGQTVCEGCFDEWSKGKDNLSCPHCRKECNPPGIDKRTERFIQDQTVYCTHHSLGCDWKGELRSLKSHLGDTCNYTIIKCSTGSCNAEYQRFLQEVHAKHECLWRTVKCPFCQAMSGGSDGSSVPDIVFREMIVKHSAECLHFPVRCPNMCEDRQWTRGTLKQHLDKCPKQVVSCDFKEFGCNVSTLRESMLAHADDFLQRHLSMLLTSHRLLQERVTRLEENQTK